MRLSLTFLLIGLFLACSDKPGKDILTRPQMQSVIWDMMQVDEFATGYLYNDTALILKDERLKLYKDVFRIHKVSQKTFTDSYKYYSARPDLMKELFDSLASHGEREKKILYQPKDTVPAKGLKADSTANSIRPDTTFKRDTVRRDSAK